jgi:O-antigen ligase
MVTLLNPLRDPATDLPYTAHDDFVRVLFETGALGLLAYLIYGLLLSLWALRVARSVQPRWAPGAFGVVASFLALYFLTGGTPEFGTQTAVQYEVYAMLGLLTALPQRERMEGESPGKNLGLVAPTAGD